MGGWQILSGPPLPVLNEVSKKILSEPSFAVSFIFLFPQIQKNFVCFHCIFSQKEYISLKIFTGVDYE